jgi:hypothetical protein
MMKRQNAPQEFDNKSDDSGDIGRIADISLRERKVTQVVKF